jgi:hypothetical protein
LLIGELNVFLKRFANTLQTRVKNKTAANAYQAPELGGHKPADDYLRTLLYCQEICLGPHHEKYAAFCKGEKALQLAGFFQTVGIGEVHENGGNGKHPANKHLGSPLHTIDDGKTDVVH